MTLKERHGVKRQQPGARTGRWTDAEHQEFLRLHVIHGRRWTLIADEMPFRTEPQIRSHAQKHYLKVSQREAQEAAERAAVALGIRFPPVTSTMPSRPAEESLRVALLAQVLSGQVTVRVRTLGGRVATVLERRQRGWFVVELDGNANEEGFANERKSLRRPQFAEGQNDILNALPIRPPPTNNSTAPSVFDAPLKIEPAPAPAHPAWPTAAPAPPIAAVLPAAAAPLPAPILLAAPAPAAVLSAPPPPAVLSAPLPPPPTMPTVPEAAESKMPPLSPEPAPPGV